MMQCTNQCFNNISKGIQIESKKLKKLKKLKERKKKG